MSQISEKDKCVICGKIPNLNKSHGMFMISHICSEICTKWHNTEKEAVDEWKIINMESESPIEGSTDAVKILEDGLNNLIRYVSKAGMTLIQLNNIIHHVEKNNIGDISHIKQKIRDVRKTFDTVGVDWI